MRKLLITFLCLTCCLLNACFLRPYQPNIQQGNILTPRQVQQVHLGMSKDSVAELLGTPVLDNTFDDNHWPYVYTFQRNGGPITKKQLDLYFRNDRLVRITGNYQ
ncbi:MAG TPA: outer membrane protein assembly factor BamE [Gammaproteobacteria bacterium]|nr:outer membrane protein assembly factor BamE [Gammaproteobacteria bacterium]